MKIPLLVCNIVSMLIIPCVLITGCENRLNTEEVIQAARDAIVNLNTYQYKIVTIWSGTHESELDKFTFEMDGTRDEINKKLHTFMKVNYEEPTFDSTGEMSFESYVVDDWVYSWDSEDNSWSRWEFSEYYWQEQATARRCVDLLTELSPVISLNTEIINEIECYKLQLEPDSEKVWDWVSTRQFSQFLEGYDFTTNLVNEYSLLLWVSKDTFFPVKAMAEVLMQDGKEIINYTNTVYIRHFNEAVSIELPPEVTELDI